MATFITDGPDGTLWFTEPNGKIGKLTTAGEINEFVFSDPYANPKK
jgi:streptogramin lyase